VISADVAVWAAFGLGLVVLAVQGWEFARVERLGCSGPLPRSPRISGSACSWSV
jgi:hypothetical protein